MRFLVSTHPPFVCFFYIILYSNIITFEMYFFTVLTYPGGCPQSVTDLALRYCENKFSKYIIVTELGKSGRNLHVNIVYEIDDALANIGLVILVRIGSNVILAFLHLPTRALLLLSALILLKM